MTISQMIPMIKNELGAVLPNILASFDAGQFSEYRIGYPVDQEKTCLCVRIANGGDEGTNSTLGFIIHAQMPGILEEQSYRFVDAINEYLAHFFYPGNFGYERMTYNFVFMENFRPMAVEAMWDVSLTGAKDDCDS